MKKMKTLFEQDENYKVIPVLRKKIDNYSVSVKKDGTSCMIKDNVLYKRYDANRKKGRKLPNENIECQEKPNHNGSFPVWVKINENDKYHIEAFLEKVFWENGTYELCGVKINGNKENIQGHKLLKHGDEQVYGINLNFEEIKEYLTNNYIEGLIIKDESDGELFKIRRKDFGLKW